MNKKFLQSLMKMAHSIARNMEGHYSVRIKIGMMQAWKILKNSMPKTSPKAVTKAVTTEAMKKPATKKDRPLFYELTYNVKSAKMWTKHGKHRLYVKFSAQWKDYWAGKLTDFNDEFYVFVDLLKNKVVPLTSRGEILKVSLGRVRDAIADQVGQEVASNREKYIAETKKKIAEYKRRKAEEKRREEEARRKREEEERRKWEEEKRKRWEEYNSGPRYFRATRSGYDAETGERIYEGDLIYYSEIHGGYCRADNY